MLVVARFAGVCAVGSQSVRPTIVQVDDIGVGNVLFTLVVADLLRCVGISCSLAGELAMAFDVCLIKVGL